MSDEDLRKLERGAEQGDADLAKLRRARCRAGMCCACGSGLGLAGRIDRMDVHIGSFWQNGANVHYHDVTATVVIELELGDANIDEVARRLEEFIRGHRA